MRGFTVIEILLVVAIFTGIASVGFLGIPNYYDRYLFSNEVNELVDDLYFVKQMTVAEQVNYSIRFDHENNSYSVIKHGEEEEKLKEKDFSGGIEVVEVENYSEVKFNYFGAVFKSGKIKLKKDSNERIINIRPSGHIHVERINTN